MLLLQNLIFLCLESYDMGWFKNDMTCSNGCTTIELVIELIPTSVEHQRIKDSFYTEQLFIGSRCSLH